MSKNIKLPVHWNILLVYLLLGFVVIGAGCGFNGDQSVGGKRKMERIRNVPVNSLLEVAVRSDGEIMAFLLSERQLKLFPKVKDAFLIAKIYKKFTAKTVLEKKGNYFLLFLNKNGKGSVTVHFAVKVNPIRKKII